jgi:hypothetical protein
MRVVSKADSKSEWWRFGHQWYRLKTSWAVSAFAPVGRGTVAGAKTAKMSEASCRIALLACFNGQPRFSAESLILGQEQTIPRVLT